MGSREMGFSELPESPIGVMLRGRARAAYEEIVREVGSLLAWNTIGSTNLVDKGVMGFKLDECRWRCRPS